MALRGKGVALSVLAVGTAAAVGYLLQGRRTQRRTDRFSADVGARIVTEVPDDATVVDVSSRRLRELPLADTLIGRALRADAREEWVHVTLEHDRSWDVVDALRHSLPYYEADGPAYNGVYVRCDDRIVVIDAIGWARLEEPIA